MDNKQIEGALRTVAREKCKRGFWLSNTDVEHFKNAISEVERRNDHKYQIPEKEDILGNETNESYNFSHMSRGYQQSSYKLKQERNLEGKFGGNMQRNIGVIHGSSGVKCNGSSTYKGEEAQQWKDSNPHVPAGARIVKCTVNVIRVYTATYSCQADIKVRVYARKYVKNGALGGGVVGGAGGAAGVGAVGGVTGAVIGASVGTVVPVAGNIIGGLIGGGIGLAIGLVVGGLGGAGTGAGIGGAVCHEKYLTVTAREVFKKLSGFKEKDNVVYCELPISTTSTESVTILQPSHNNCETVAV